MRTETPLIQQRQLQAQLRHARENAQLSQKEVAEALDWSLSKMIRIETGAVGLSIADLKALLMHYGITDREQVNDLVALAHASKKQGWWTEYRQYYNQQFLTFLKIEDSAVRTQQFQGLVIPGLLQTPDYISALFAAYPRPETAEVRSKGKEIRLRRQSFFLAEQGREAYFILDESVLYRMTGDAQTMQQQLQHLKDASSLPNVSLQIVPLSAGVHKGLSQSFSIYSFSDDYGDCAVNTEGVLRDSLITNQPKKIKEYIEVFEELSTLSWTSERSLLLIDKALQHWETQTTLNTPA